MIQTTASRHDSHIAMVLIAATIALLFWFRLTDFYHQHFFDTGPGVVAWQAARMLMVPVLVWLQYTVGAYAIYHLHHREFPLHGIRHFIASFLLGTTLWHLVLFAMGLAGLLLYPLLLPLVIAVLIASHRHLANCIASWQRPIAISWDERFVMLLVTFAALLFLCLKGTYPSGGHDFFNHYFPYYKEVAESGHLGPHASWYHYHYSKGLGVYFLSMILLDPLAVHLVGTSFVIVAAAMLFDLLQKPGTSRLLPLFAVFMYLMCYIYTPGRGIFALNGGWGDLEKTHELTGVLLFASLWIIQRAEASHPWLYRILLMGVAATNVLIGFASGFVGGLFFAFCLVWGWIRKDRSTVLLTFYGGIGTGISILVVMCINWWNTGLPQDQLELLLWDWIDWKKIVQLGHTLELYSHYMDLTSYRDKALPLSDSWLKMIVEYYRLYTLWPLLFVGAGFWLYQLFKQRAWRIEGIAPLCCFLLAGYIFAIAFGGRSQFISFFRFSSFNYAPNLLFCFLLWRLMPVRALQITVRLYLSVWIFLIGGVTVAPSAASNGPDFVRELSFKLSEWQKLFHSAWQINSGQYSLYDAVQDQRGRIGRMPWGGVHPAMRIIYDGLPPKTRVWSFYNHSYCLLPTCNVQQYFSQITSPRWYDIALGSTPEGKKIMQEEGLNFFFYSRNIDSFFASNTKDQLAAFYHGFSPEQIDKTLGILWTNGHDYLLTWKEEAVRPLDAGFLESWRGYYVNYVLPGKDYFPVDKLAVMVKKAVEDPSITHPPRPDW